MHERDLLRVDQGFQLVVKIGEFGVMLDVVQ